jgi:hypothetical protein
MGLWRARPKIYFWVFKCRWCRRINVSRKKYIQKREQGIRKYLSRSTSSSRLRVGGCVIRREEQLKGQIMSINITRRSIWNMSIYFLEPIPKKFWL